MKSKKKTSDEKAADRAALRVDSKYDGTYEQAFLAGVRYGRRTASEAIKVEPILNDPIEAPLRTEFWKGVLAGKTWALRAIRVRSRK